jgi:hypothetical protein
MSEKCEGPGVSLLDKNPIKGRCGNGQALCVFFLNKRQRGGTHCSGTEELVAHQGLAEGGFNQGDPLNSAWKAGPAQGL